MIKNSTNYYFKRIIKKKKSNKNHSLASPMPSAFIENIASASGKHGES